MLRGFWVAGDGVPYLEAIEAGQMNIEEVAHTVGKKVDAVQQAYRSFLLRKGAYVPGSIDWTTKPPSLGVSATRRPVRSVQALERGSLEALIQAAVEYAGEKIRDRMRELERENEALRSEGERLRLKLRESESLAEQRMRGISNDAMRRAGLVGGD